MMVSVCMITYNHGSFIREAIESIIEQKTEFDFELVIGEDCSTDDTRKICQEYASQYPKIIRLLDSEKNLGVIPNFIRTLEACKGKYIAMCEGDDYWINPHKLHKQVRFLEENSKYSLCFHDAIVRWENKSSPPYNFCKGLSKTIFNIEDVINSWLMPSASMMFRSNLLFPLPNWFKDIYNGDYALQLLLILKGDFYFTDQVMSVYRQHATNLSANTDNYKINRSITQLLILFNEHSDFKYNRLIRSRLKRLSIFYRIDKAKKICLMIPYGEHIWQSISYFFRLFKIR